MTIHHTAYDTTACAGFRMAPIVDAILEAQLRDHLDRADGVAYVDASNGASGQIKAFKHAVYIHKSTNPQDHRGARTHYDEAILAMDLRACGRFDAQLGRFKVTNSTMYKNLVYRGGLSSVWLTSGANAFRAITPTATAIFASWLSEAIGFKYQLDPKSKIELMILAGLFYQSNHVEGIEFDKGNEDRYLSAVANALKVSVTDVKRIYTQSQVIVSIEDFCTKAKTVLGNVRLENLNHGVLVTLMGGTWAGDNAIELCAVAMEHPPTWISLIYEAYTNLALKKVGLSRIVERPRFADGMERLVQTLRSILPESTAKVDSEATSRF
jgi:hypothetical protein